MDVTTQWSWNDGWILMATYMTHGTEGARLHELIGAADSINHAIPTAKELSRAFRKFAQAGIVRIVGTQFRLNDELLPQIERAYKARGGLFESAKKGEKWLKSLSVGEINTADILITEQDVADAYDTYTATIKKR